jgi:hypothetical protein
LRRLVLVYLVTLGSGVLLVSCSSSPTKDPATQVTVADYRATLALVRSNMVAGEAALRRIQSELPQARPAVWWDAQIGVLEDTASLCSDVLNGALPVRANKSP